MGYVERESSAAALLLERMEAEDLEPAPIWCGNLEELDTAPFRGLDWVLAGLPCQPYSVAGKRRGLSDERAIWPAARAIIEQVGARFVLMENVPGSVPIMLPGVLGDLAEMGFDAEWVCVRAEHVGASHRRERLFLLAHTKRIASAGWRGPGDLVRSEGRAQEEGEQRERCWGSAGYCGEVLADPRSPRRKERGRIGGNPGEECQAIERSCESMENAQRKGRGKRNSPAGRGSHLGLSWVRRACSGFPPGPSKLDQWSKVLEARPDLAPAIPKVRGVDDGLPDWVDRVQRFRKERLRALGNAVVPAQGAAALRELLGRIE